MSHTMTFRLNDSGNLSLVKDNILNDMKRICPITSSINESTAKKSFLSKLSENYNEERRKNATTTMLSIAPIPIIMATTASTGIGASGVFWDAFMKYIFPWMLDIAKVFCAIKIAQGFYQEKRGGKDEGTGFGSLVTYGKWYLVFWLIPWGVELIDQIGSKMLNDLKVGGL